jgi:hypothetical protein
MSGVMGARTCLLCGKPLSRIWAGTGEDFCSREHRNQYRLRRGMDRLQEANKVASVMRRRESARQIPAATLRSAGPLSKRGFFDSQLPRESRLAGFSPPRVRAALPAALAPSSGFLAPHANIGSERPFDISNSMPASFTPQPPLAPAVTMSLPAHVAQAPATSVSHQAADASYKRRVLILSWRGAKYPLARDPRKRGASPGATNPIESSRPARRVVVASMGRALRVSMAAGFRIPEWKLRAIALARPEIAGMRWPELRTLAPAAAVKQAVPSPASVEIAAPAMCVPAAPPHDVQRRFPWPGAMKISIQFVDSETRQRTTFVPFGNPDESLAKERR